MAAAKQYQGMLAETFVSTHYLTGLGHKTHSKTSFLGYYSAAHNTDRHSHLPLCIRQQCSSFGRKGRAMVGIFNHQHTLFFPRHCFRMNKSQKKDVKVSNFGLASNIEHRLGREVKLNDRV